MSSGTSQFEENEAPESGAPFNPPPPASVMPSSKSGGRAGQTVGAKGSMGAKGAKHSEDLDSPDRLKGFGESATEGRVRSAAFFAGGGESSELNLSEKLGVDTLVELKGSESSADNLSSTGTVEVGKPKVHVTSADEDHDAGLSDGLNLSGGPSSSNKVDPANSLPRQFSVMRDAGQAETIAASDALNRATLIRAVADFLATRADSHALAMALFGAWGSGKSSFIDFLRKELSTRKPKVKFHFAEFNAWKNERVDNIGAALAQAVVDSLVSHLTIFGQFRLAMKIARKRTERLRKGFAEDASGVKRLLTGAWLEWWTVFVPFVMWPVVTGLTLYVVFAGSSAPGWASNTLAAIGAAASAVFSAKSVLSDQLLNWFKDLAKDKKFSFKLLPDYAEKLGSFHEMGRTLDDLVSLSLAPASESSREYLLLVVDDLDRCSSDTIKLVFDAVRLVAHIQQVVVLVALDERIAYAAVAKHYADYGRDPALVARDYLAKVFNVFVTLPNADKTAIRNYVSRQLFSPPTDTDVPGGLAGPEGSFTTNDEQPTSTRRPVQDLQSTSKLEVETFADLVENYRLTNPRELWRLRQTWALLKGVALAEQASDAEVRSWMEHMFFRENFLRGTAEQREAGDQLLDNFAPPAHSPSDLVGQLWNKELTEAARALRTGFRERDPIVMAVLLPAAPPGFRAPNSK